MSRSSAGAAPGVKDAAPSSNVGHYPAASAATTSIFAAMRSSGNAAARASPEAAPLQRHPSATSLASSTLTDSSSLLSPGSTRAAQARAAPTAGAGVHSSPPSKGSVTSPVFSTPPAAARSIAQQFGSPLSASSTSSRHSGYEGSPDSPASPYGSGGASHRSYPVASAASNYRGHHAAAPPSRASQPSLTSPPSAGGSRPQAPPSLRTQTSGSASGSSFGLASPPLHRSSSPERLFSPSGARKLAAAASDPRVQQSGSSSSAQGSKLDATRGGADLLAVQQLLRQERQKLTDSNSSNSSNISLRSPPGTQQQQRPHLSLQVDSSANSITSPAPAVLPLSSVRSSGSASSASNLGSPPPSSGAKQSPPPGTSFVRGQFIGSPLSFDDDDDDDGGGDGFDEDDDGDEEGGGIEILETIPASEEALQSFEQHHHVTAAELEERDALERAAARPNLKLRMGSAGGGGGGGGSSIATTAASDSRSISLNSSSAYSSALTDSATGGDAFVRGTSPKNANVFGLRLKHTSDASIDLGNGPGSNDSSRRASLNMLTNSSGGGGGGIGSTPPKTLHASQSQQEKQAALLNQSLNDSLTSSGRLALANFHQSQAANSSKRMPGVSGGGGGSKRGSRSGAAGGHGPQGGGGGKHRVNESYDVSQHGTLLLGGFEIGSTGVQRTPHVEHWVDESIDDLAEHAAHALSMGGGAGAEHAHGALPRIGETTSGGGGGSSPGDDSLPAATPTPLRSGSQSRRPSAVAARFLTSPSPPTSFATPAEAALAAQVSNQIKAASLGVEFRLQDMVRLGDLGVGQNGTVVKACYLPTLRIVALKTCTVFEKDERHQLVKELRAFNACSSPHIISFVGAAFLEGKITMALEYMNRGSLDQVVKKQGPLTIPMLRSISRQVCKGLKHMHARKCIHRDIKPANILIDNEGNCKISDFGLLKQLDSTQEMASTFVGTMLYLSPERITGDAFSYASDIWSWGISLIFLATGSLNLPRDYWAMLNFVRLPSPTLDRAVFPASLCDFVDRCLVKDPATRATASELLKHPFLLEVEPAATPHTELWPLSSGKDPDARELEVLVQAVADHFYLTPAEAASVHAGAAPPTPSPGSSVTRAEFTGSPLDQSRIELLAQQMAWNVRPVQEAFEKKLLRGKQQLQQQSIGSPNAPPAVSVSASSSDAPVTAPRRRRKSITLDKDPHFHAGAGAGADADEALYSHTPSSHTPSSAYSGSGGTRASLNTSSSFGSGSGRVLHTVSAQRRPDDSSGSEFSEDDHMRSPQIGGAGARTLQTQLTSSGNHGRARGASAPPASSSSSVGFDPNASIRTMLRDAGNVAGARSAAAAAARGAGPPVNASLAKQLELLAEEDDSD